MEKEMKTVKKENNYGGGSEHEDQKWVYDSSVDYRGKIPLRSSTGVWKASLFIIAIEFSERLSYFGIATNLITYLTQIMHQDLNTAAKNVNYWAGVTTIMPLIGGFLADAYTGRFAMVLFSSFVYLMGLILLAMSQYVPSLKPCGDDRSSTCNGGRPRESHVAVFFVALYLISVGTGGHKPCLESFGADQFDDNHRSERRQKMSFFNWWNSALCGGLLLGVTVIVYVQDYVSWGLAYLIISIVMAITILVFCCGRSCFRYRVPHGSPFTPMFQVLVAAFRNRGLVCPSDPSSLHEVPFEPRKNQGRLLCHTPRLGFLDKAAMKEENNKDDNNNNPWRLSTVTKVEETKLIINTVPIWLTSLMFGLCLSLPATFFVKQAASTNLHLGPHFRVPPASVFAFGALAMILTVVIYDRLLDPSLRRATGNERGLSILQRIGLGMALSVVAMVVAALVEIKRLGMVERDEVMSMFWLVPQYVIFGVADGFTLVGLQEYFYDQVPDSMRSLGIALYLSVIGAGSFLGSFLIYVVDSLTKSGSGNYPNGWIGKNLKTSRLDKFYWLLAGMSGLNLCAYVFVAKRYTYKNVERRDCDDHNRNGVEEII